jgi:hypothetical protein
VVVFSEIAFSDRLLGAMRVPVPGRTLDVVDVIDGFADHGGEEQDRYRKTALKERRDINLNPAVGLDVGANSFAYSRLGVRMNSHLR